ncbi:MAG: Nodulation protein N [Devosiaceae bacterium]|nr:Nodulation protein N [Devosiaceae bacterium]
MTLDFSDLTSLEAATGKTLGTSRWFTMDQTGTDSFGNLTRDLHPMHVDPEWSAHNSPFGQSIVHGFHTLSMVTAMMSDILSENNSNAPMLNYGFDRVRFLTPVKVGASIRAEAKLHGVRTRANASAIVSIRIKVDIKEVEKAALSADWLFFIPEIAPKN